MLRYRQYKGGIMIDDKLKKSAETEVDVWYCSYLKGKPSPSPQLPDGTCFATTKADGHHTCTKCGQDCEKTGHTRKKVTIRMM